MRSMHGDYDLLGVRFAVLLDAGEHSDVGEEDLVKHDDIIV